MARSGHSTRLSPGRHRAHQPQTQKLMETEISELKNYLPEWTSVKRSEKRAVFTAISRAARLFAPKVDQGQWKKRKQMYKTWLFNNKKKKERKDMIKYGRKWTPRMVIYQENWEEVLKRIEDESGAKPGDPGMFKHYQAAVKRVMAELSDDELEKAKETAEEWSPVRRDLHIWSTFEGDVEAMRDESIFQPNIFHAGNDNSEALGDGDSFMKTKDWEDIEPVWQEYAQEQFGAGAREGGRQMKGGCKRIRKPAFELDTDEDGMPLLPDITETKLEEKKAIVRAFLTSHYRICLGIDKAVVPWSAILQCQDDFEPSKLQNWDTTALLNFWYARQEKGKGSTFTFKAWKNKDGDMVASVISGGSPSHRTRKVKNMQRVIIRSPRDSSSEPDSDFGNDTHHPDDDDDDDDDDNDDDDNDDNDSADGRSPKRRTRTGEGPSSSHAETAIPPSIPKPRPVKPAKCGALLTSQMGDLLAGLTNGNIGEVDDDVAMEGRKTSPAPKRMWGKRAVIEPLARTTRRSRLLVCWTQNMDPVINTQASVVLG
ncbi:uncharacterized protein EDB93DRAFT_1301832 [Suillus bovinus]|uniref:uncharacterized protein n=1 Tax=Suillus bovinus TaxID=48563 RepID=UPI001B87DE4C|nr:uncharacterized protein EDB93DRAFT_1301832 [Suillus bovinus]KAG2137903.1 hypothetical protein EDB93DRAFT_1301832 [Suillus bovinus]